jgi:hypothetical protein
MSHTMRVVAVSRSEEDSAKPFAVHVQFPTGVVVQPVTTDEFLRALNDMLKHNDVRVEVTVTR